MWVNTVNYISALKSDTIESAGVSTMEEETGNRYKIMLVRVVVWGQAIGYLWQVVALAIEDSPDFFVRTNPSMFLWPIVVVAAMVN